MKFQDITGTRLTQSPVTTSYVSIYKVPTDTRTYVKDIDVCNTSSSPVGIYISLVPSGESAGTDNALFYNALIPGNSTLQWTGSQIMLAGDTIQVRASATGCSVTITGGEAV